MVRHFGPGERQVADRDGKLLFIYLRGRFRITGADDIEIELSVKRGRGLLAYLSLTRGFKANRQDAALQLWGKPDEAMADLDGVGEDEVDDDDAGPVGDPSVAESAILLRNLRQLLLTLRKQLGPDAMQAVRTEHETVGLVQSLVWVDVIAELAAIGTIDDPLPNWVVDQLPLLQGFGLLRAPFDDWIKTEARDYKARKEFALTRRAEALEKRGTTVERLIIEYRALTDWAPSDEILCRRLMELLATTGINSLKEIEQVFERCKAAVREDTGEDIEEETQAAYERACALCRETSGGDWRHHDRERSKAAEKRERQSPPDAPICVGVRPLVNLSGETALDRLSRQLNGNILTDLGMLQRPFELMELPPAGGPPVPRQSQCDYIVSTTIELERRSGVSYVLINMSLVDAARETVLRTNRASFLMTDAFEGRRPLSAQIAGKIHVDLLTFHALHLEGTAESELTVTKLLTLGQAMLTRRNTPANVWAAMRYFGSALVRDDRNVDALAGAAHVYHRLATQPAFSDNPAEAARRGLACVATALDRDPNHVRARYVSGLLSSVQGDPGRAEATFEFLLGLSAHLPTTVYRAYNWCFLDRPQAARDELRLITAPLHGDSSLPIYLFFLGFSEVHCGELEAAIGSFRRSLHVEPSYTSSKVWLAACEFMNGNVAEAQRTMAEFRAAFPGYTIAEFEVNWGAGRTSNQAYLERTKAVVDALRALGVPQRL